MITIINGGTQGLGEAVARKLVADGATGLVLAGRSLERGNALAAELTALGTPSTFVAADVGDPDAPAAIVDACAARFGTVHGLVNVAALTTRATLFRDTPEHFDRMMAHNVRAPYFLIQAAARLMVATDTAGSIVNVGSTSGHGGQTKLTAYAISKGALAIMTRNLAYGLMRHGIRVNQVNPGLIGDGVRAPHADRAGRRARRLARAGRADAPVRAPRAAVGGGQRDRVLSVARLRADDRQRDRRRPVGAGRRRSAGPEPRRHRLAVRARARLAAKLRAEFTRWKRRPPSPANRP
jgi:NAD(P)-dependent dehydrogenase (short-subunit alcohol dehydrogenase family)